MMVNKKKRKLSRKSKEDRYRKRENHKRQLKKQQNPPPWSEKWFGDKVYLYIDDPKDISDIGKRPDFLIETKESQWILAEHKKRTTSYTEWWLQNVMEEATGKFLSLRTLPDFLDSSDLPAILILLISQDLAKVQIRVADSLNSKENNTNIDIICLLAPGQKGWSKQAVCFFRRDDLVATKAAFDFLDYLYYLTTGELLPGFILVSEVRDLEIDNARIML